MNRRFLAAHAVRDFAFREDALEKPCPVPVDRADDAGNLGEVDAQADDVWHDQESEPMNSQPNEGFEWVQAAGGPALVCLSLRPFADHLFTTRDWALGSPDGGADADW